MNIEVGKRYRTRSGDVVEIVSKDKYGDMPFKGLQHSKHGNHPYEWCVKPDGTIPLNSRRNHKDLIEELPACISCGEIATRECDEQAHFGQCGHWLCDNCEHDCQNGGHARK